MKITVARGFSLIELLVALAIFSTMAAISYAGLSAVTRSYSAVDERERELAALGRSLTGIERDLRSVARRSIRDGDGQVLPALLAGDGRIELSTHGRGRGGGLGLGLVERVAWWHADSGLRRARWPVLDRTAATRPDQRLLLDQVQALRWRFLTADGRWLERWPAPASTDVDELPRAVELVLRHDRLGEIRRLIELPDS